jgi:hypothetical protein
MSDEKALAVASYAVVMELLALLHDKGIVSQHDEASVLDAALAGLENTSTQHSDDGLTLARQLIDRQLKLWQRDRST